MNEQQLHYIQIIAEQGSIQKASVLCGKNPSTLTRVLRNSEKELGAELFRRTRKKMLLTPEGEAAVAAEHQGGLGTASSSNIGNPYAMFEAIHGTAPYLMSHGRGEYADPSSLIRAAGMLLAHIGFVEKKELLEKAMDICTVTERKVVLTTFTKDASTREFTDYVIKTINRLS